jgi:hypothetical protein
VKPTATLLLLAALAAPGCAGLVVRDDDSPGRRRAKAGAHGVLTLATLGVFPRVQAEVEAAESRRLEERAAQDAAARFRLRWLHRILEARTPAELSAAFGAPPRACRPRADRTEVCVWTSRALLVRALEAHAAPAGRVRVPLPRITTDQVVVAACELPTDGGDRAPHSCDVDFW